MKWSLSRSTTIALLLSPVGILLISITRLLIVSDYNSTTASTIASSGGYVNTLLGTFVPVVPLFMPYFAVVLLFLDRTVLAILSFTAAVFTSPTAITEAELIKSIQKDGRLYSNNAHLQIVGFLALFFILFLAIEVLGLNIQEAARTASLIIGLALIPFVLLLYPIPFQSSFYAQQLQQPWLPAETIVLDSRQSIVGYVLSEDEVWFVVLQARNRRVYYFHETQVANREVCELGPINNKRPIIDLFSAPTSIPKCPSNSSAVP